MTVPIPKDAISSESILHLQASAVAQQLSGLESMLRQPNGCFEQTTATNYPNVMILDLLEHQGQATTEVRRKALAYLRRGKQRLLKFEIKGGGFSLYGKRPASPWLSALALMQFHDMRRHVTIDQDVFTRTWAWLAPRLTALPMEQRAFAEWAAARCGLADRTIRDRLRPSGTNDQADLYVINARLEYGTNAELRRQATTLATSILSGTVAGPKRSFCYRGGRGFDVQRWALALMALKKADAAPDLQKKLIDRLIAARSAYGWPGTRATVLALQALKSSAKPAVGTLVLWNDAGFRQRLAIDTKKSLRPMLVSVPATHPLKCELEGSGEITAQLIGKSYLRWRDEENQLSREGVNLALKFNRSEVSIGSTVNAVVTLRAVGRSCENGIIELATKPALRADEGLLKRLVGVREIEKYEQSDRGITIYLDTLRNGAKKTLTIPLRATVAGMFTLPPSKAYQYYEPTDCHVIRPGQMRITPKESK